MRSQRNRKMLLEKIMHANLIKCVYQAVFKMNPAIAIHLKNFGVYLINQSAFNAIKKKCGLRADQQVNPIFLNLDFFASVNLLNKKENTRDELYFLYLDALMNSDALKPLLLDLPTDVKQWMTKLIEARFFDEQGVFDVLPHNEINHAIGTALYMCLLGRLPESAQVINRPIQQMAAFIMGSEEYMNFNGHNLTAWLKS